LGVNFRKEIFSFDVIKLWVLYDNGVVDAGIVYQLTVGVVRAVS
jgi:hypothetical protein